MQGACTTRTPGPSVLVRSAISASAPAMAQDKEFADPHRHRRRRRLAFFDHVEMRIKGRDLIDFGLRELHFGRQRRKMRRGDVAVFVLNQMQMLDEQIAAARAVGQQRLDIGGGLRIDLTALRACAADVAAPLVQSSQRRYRRQFG